MIKITLITFLLGIAPGHAAQNQIPLVTDSQIIKILISANNGKIALSEFAKKSSNKEVHRLGKMMIEDHSQANTEVERLVQSLALRPSESQDSRDFKRGTENQLDGLKDLRGQNLDRAYIEDLADAHRVALKELDEKLIPSAQNSQLKSYLLQTREKVMTHLAQTKEVQAAVVK